MSALDELMTDLADLHEATARRLRLFVDTGREPVTVRDDAPLADRVVAAARRLHDSIGPRQVEALRLIAGEHPNGVGTGALVKAMNYDQPNVYLTLQSLVERNYKFVRKDAAVSPHRYFITDYLLGEAGGDSA